MSNAISAETADPSVKGSAVALRGFVKNIVPKKWRLRYHRFREERLIKGWLRDWQSIRRRTASAREPLSEDSLLIPSDTRTFSGGKGDEAMTLVTVKALRERGCTGRIHALCETPEAFAAARALGCEPFAVAQDGSHVQAFDEWLAQHRPKVAVGIGADSIDGAYGVVGPAGLLTVLDLAAARGASTLVTGFSLRARTDASLAPFFAKLRPDVRLNVRDPVSLERLRRDYGVDGTLVADTAFLLKPMASARTEVLRHWVEERRANGRVVVAVNVHPMLFPPVDDTGRAKLVETLASAILEISARRSVAWALIAHDFRPGDADALLLDPISRRLATLTDDLYADYATEWTAAELKAASALFDGAISARMHFAIASLGSGTPTLGIVYQGKFEGLMRLLDLPDWLLLDPRSTGPELVEAIDRFLNESPRLRDHLAQRLDNIRSLSAANFEILD